MELFSSHLHLHDLQTATRLLHESRSVFLQLFNNSPICQSMTTLDRAYVKVNRKFLETFGFSEEEVIGKTSVEAGILDRVESLRVGQMIREKGRLQNDYVKCIAKDGKIIHTVSSIENMEVDGVHYLVSFFLDISKIVEQQVILEKNAGELRALNKELEAFSYSVSHDLRAPLRAIDGYARILKEDYENLLDQEGKNVLGSVLQNVKQMGTLIDDLLNFARLGKKDLEKTSIDMEILIGEVIRELGKAFPYKGEIKTGKLYPLSGDFLLMKQVVINLLSNGLKYSSKKDHPLVEISSEIRNNQVIYCFKDNGAGFDMKYADKLFGVFQRLHSAEEFEGTGVGLATVYRIITKHGGSISAKAEVGKGASFTFSLPLEY